MLAKTMMDSEKVERFFKWISLNRWYRLPTAKRNISRKQKTAIRNSITALGKGDELDFFSILIANEIVCGVEIIDDIKYPIIEDCRLYLIATEEEFLPTIFQRVKKNAFSLPTGERYVRI